MNLIKFLIHSANENYEIKSSTKISALTVNGVIAVGKKALTKSMTVNVISLYNIHFGQNKKSFFIWCTLNVSKRN